VLEAGHSHALNKDEVWPELSTGVGSGEWAGGVMVVPHSGDASVREESFG
jgi:hypothetical protein